eukprot:472791-Pyramimonas_sp.AAC.2
MSWNQVAYDDGDYEDLKLPDESVILLPVPEKQTGNKCNNDQKKEEESQPSRDLCKGSRSPCILNPNHATALDEEQGDLGHS